VNIDDWLLEILACPQCRAGLRADESASELVCTGCGLAYPVRDDIPVLLVDEARQSSPAPAAPSGGPTPRTPGTEPPTAANDAPQAAPPGGSAG
jgi:hypothetical protein